MSLRTTGRKYYIGVALILFPYSLATWVADLISTRNAGALAAPLAVAQAILFFGVVIVGATYVTRVYLRGAEVATSSHFA